MTVGLQVGAAGAREGHVLRSCPEALQDPSHVRRELTFVHAVRTDASDPVHRESLISPGSRNPTSEASVQATVSAAAKKLLPTPAQVKPLGERLTRHRAQP